ncbi:MAG: hypothetical protein FWH37_09320 [Candidatus Bathyarchaeota archaeon]|nr:hypothetical protein [Candidatus Termiticorpusculum sp.]
MNKNINKKLMITSIAILLCITMLASLTPQTIAQTTDANQPTTPTRGTMSYANQVISTTGFVSMPQNILGSFDGYSVYMYRPDQANQAKIVVRMSTYVYSGSKLIVRAAVEKNNCDACTIEVYVSSNSNSGMTCIGSKKVNTQYLDDYDFNTVSQGFEYVTIALIGYPAGVYPAGVYVDGIITY